LLLRHELLWQKIILPELSKLEWLKNGFDDIEVPGTKFRQLESKAGSAIRIEGFGGGYSHGGSDWYNVVMTVHNFDLQIVTNGKFRLRMEDGRLKVNWDHESSSTPVGFVTYGDNTVHPTSAKLHVIMTFTATYSFNVVQEGGKPVIKLELDDSDTAVLLDLVEWGSNVSWKEELKAEVRKNGPPKFRVAMEPLHEQLKSMTATVDAFRLNNLLFRGNNIVTPRGAYLPGDLTLLGDLAPDRTRLVVSPTEVVVAGGKSQQFTSNLEGAVNWSVENLPGESSDPGTINPQTGVYQAPSSADLRTDGFRRVIVSATQDDMTSKALVSLVESQVSIYPSVLVMEVGGAKHSLAAGSADKSPLKWELGGDH
ncbi:MAG: hypothetical protein ACRESP_19840, partial [Pseudomonas sp.]